MLKYSLLFLIWGIFSVFSYAQTTTKDSLQNAFAQTQIDSVRVLAGIELCAMFQTKNPDSAFYFAKKSLEISEKIAFDKGLLLASFQLGMLYYTLGNYDQSLQYLLKTAENANKKQFLKIQANAYNQIGMLYQNQNDHSKAFQYLDKALGIRQEIGDKIGEAHTLSRFGVSYEQLQDYEKALYFSEKSLEMNEKYGTKQSLSTSYNNIGFIYTRYKDYKKAFPYLFKALKLKQEIKDKAITTLNNLGICYQLAGQHEVSLKYSFESLKAAQQTREKLRIKEASETISQTYRLMGNAAESLKYYEIFTNYKDSLINERLNREIMGLELQRNEAENEKLKKDNLLKESELENAQATVRLQYLTLLFGLLFLLLLSLLAFVFYRNRQKEHKTNELLRIKSEEINLQNEELRQTQEAIILQKNMLEEKNEQLEAHKTKITQSIYSANIIQTAILPTPAKMNTLFAEHFILFLPKDVVSGDFYWATKIGKQRFLIVADCTGHGVSGAFMTMIGNTLIDRIIRVFDIHDPARILTLLHIEVQNVLQQDQTGNTDGMDIGMVVLEEKENEQEIVFAGARRPLYYVETNTTETKKVMGTRKSIGGKDHHHKNSEDKDKEFKNTVLTLPRGSMLYLSSDGYADQSDPKRHGFSEKRFINMLSLLQKKTLPEQRIFLEEALQKHQGDSEQRDDILVVGVRV